MLFYLLFLNFYRFAFGPQHPASHGVLTCLLYLSNEYIIFADMVIGYLHRGTEKLIEYKKNNQIIPYFDRLDYVSVIFCEETFVYSFEGLFRYVNKQSVSLSRIIFMELTRIFNGLLAVSCMVMDIGSISPIM